MVALSGAICTSVRSIHRGIEYLNAKWLNEIECLNVTTGMKYHEVTRHLKEREITSHAVLTDSVGATT